MKKKKKIKPVHSICFKLINGHLLSMVDIGFRSALIRTKRQSVTFNRRIEIHPLGKTQAVG